MINIKNCDVELYDDGRIAFVRLPSEPDYDTMMMLGRGRPITGTILLATAYKLNGIDYYLHR